MNRIATVFVLFLSCAAVFAGQPSEEEKLNARIDEMLKGLENQDKPDFSAKSTEKIVSDFVFSAPRSTLYCDFMKEELAKRPEETKNVIEDALRGKELSVEYIGGLPVVASVFGKDYEVEVAERCLFHPSAVRYDGWFVGCWDMLVHFENSGKDLAYIAERLVEDGRLELGSSAWREWTGKLTVRRIDGASADDGARSQERSERNIARKTTQLQKERRGNAWLIAILAAAIAAGIGFLVLRKQNA